MDIIKEIQIDRNSKEPLYKQLKETILNMIWNNQLVSGQLLPTESELSTKLNISKATVRQCMNELAFEGYVDKRRNRGTIILNRKVNLGYSDSISDFNERIKGLGMTPKTELINISIEIVDKEVYGFLNISLNQKVINLVRLRKVNDIPVVLINSYIPYEDYKYILSRDFENESLYSLLSEREENTLTYVRRRVYASETTEEVGAILGFRVGGALLTVETLAFNEKDEVMEYSISYSPEDRNDYTFVVNREKKNM